MSIEPQMFVITDRPAGQPMFAVMHNHERIWKVLRADDTKISRSITRGLERRVGLYASCHVSSHALRPSKDGHGNPTYELSGLGMYQLMNLHTRRFAPVDADGNQTLRPDHILTDRQGLQTAEQWLDTLAFIAQDVNGNLLTGDTLREPVDDPARYQARHELEVNRQFWTGVLGG